VLNQRVHHACKVFYEWMYGIKRFVAQCRDYVQDPHEQGLTTSRIVSKALLWEKGWGCLEKSSSRLQSQWASNLSCLLLRQRPTWCHPVRIRTLEIGSSGARPCSVLLHEHMLNALYTASDSFMFVAGFADTTPWTPAVDATAASASASASACHVPDHEVGVVKGRHGGHGGAGATDSGTRVELSVSPLVLAAHSEDGAMEEGIGNLLQASSSSKVEQEDEVLDGFVGDGDRDADRGEFEEGGAVVDLMAFSPKGAESTGGSSKPFPAKTDVMEDGGDRLGLASQLDDKDVGAKLVVVGQGEVDLLALSPLKFGENVSMGEHETARAGEVVGGTAVGVDLLSFSPPKDGKGTSAGDFNAEFPAVSSMAEKSLADDDFLFSLQGSPVAGTAPLSTSTNNTTSFVEGDSCLQLVSGTVRHKYRDVHQQHPP
jgi:hypothetical protein